MNAIIYKRTILAMSAAMFSLLVACHSPESSNPPELIPADPTHVDQPPGVNTRPTSTPTPTPTPTPTSTSGTMQLGANSDLGGFRAFPSNNVWNQDISSAALDPNSDMYINSMGRDRYCHPDFGTVWNGAPIGNPYIVVPGTQPKVPMSFLYASESDPGPYPIPANAPISGGTNGTGDRHVIVLDRDNLKLYELYRAFPDGSGGWKADSGAVFNLATGTDRPAGWTSADAAGLPIFPGLARYDEVMLRGEITHALRFTASRTQHAYTYPARHAAGSIDPTLPPMGLRVRLKASYDISWASPTSQVVLRALKKYGMILADNGSDWMIAGSPSPLWKDSELNDIKQVPGGAFEVIKMGTITPQTY